MNRVLYLHGFASGPQSRKAQFFRDRFARRGFDLEIPELAADGFARLTITGQLAVIEKAARGEPVHLIGSSMGGYLAALYASLHREVETLVLLAPAFGFARRWESRLGAEAFAAWRESGWLTVHHYAEGEPAKIGFQLIEDALGYPDEPGFDQPALLFHGMNDSVCPYGVSVAYGARRPNVRVQLFEASHELTEVVEEIWKPLPQFFTFL
jgi:pimeloyl-ACP methyl ester carboxylesterase